MKISPLIAFALLTAVAAPRPGWLGFSFTAHRQGAEQWLIVRNVAPGGPAARAGVRLGDVITAIDGRNLSFGSYSALLASFGRIVPGQHVKLTAVQRGKSSTREVIAEPMTDEQFARWSASLELARKSTLPPPP